MDYLVKNPYIILQARMNSERLPGKVMKLVGGIPLLGILIGRIKNSKIPVLLATSHNPENDRLVEFAIKMGIKVFRGSEENVLERYYWAAKSVNSDLIFRLTGDNPFIETDLIEQIFKFYLNFNNNRVYISTGLSKTFPLGISVEAFSFQLLEEALNYSSIPGDFEHVTPYMHQNRAGNINVISFGCNKDKFHYRLTVDTLEDFELVRRLIEEYGCALKSIEEIIEILDHNPNLSHINKDIVQKKWA